MAEESLKQIGKRLKGLREVLDIPATDVAHLCDITPEHYEKIELGEADAGVYRLSKIAKRYGIELDVLLFGEEPRMNSYFVTRKHQGLCVNRRKEYKYESLASGFRGRKVEPFMVTVDPLPDNHRHGKSSHEGQEFDLIMEGSLEITIGDKIITLQAGDSIYFDSKEPHCMHAMGEQPCKFLCIVI